MRLVERMLLELNANFDGNAWHGTPLRHLVEGVSEAAATAHPIEGARSIAELTAHATAWMEIVQRRVAGENVEVTPEMDFPSVEGRSWDEMIARLERAQSALVDVVARMRDRDFDAPVPGRPSQTNDGMLRGLMSHNAYHGGQIALLRKLALPPS